MSSDLIININKFKILYNHLCRNMNKVLLLRPYFFTQKIVDDYEYQHNKIYKNYVMSYNFRQGIYRIFLIVIKFLDNHRNTVKRKSYSYRKKYIKRVNKVLSDEFSTIIELLNDLNNELIDRIIELRSVIVNTVNVSNIPYGDIETETNVNTLPVASKLIPNSFKTASWRQINSPLNSKAPLAHASPVKSKRENNRNKTAKRNANGTKI